MQRIFTICLLMISSGLINAQSLTEIINLSNITPSGTAKSNGVNGAYTALGADMISAGLNPAGIALYKKPEITITPGFAINLNESNYLGNDLNKYDDDFSVAQFGMVFTPNLRRLNQQAYYEHQRRNKQNNTNLPFKPEPAKFGMNFAIAVTQTELFDNAYEYEGFNVDNSLMDRFVQRANDINSDQLYFEQLAADVGIIRTVNNDSTLWASTLQFADGSTEEDLGVLQNEYIVRDGQLTDINFTVAAHFEDKVYIGASLGLPTMSFEQQNWYSEEDTENTIPEFGYFEIKDYKNIETTGVNGTFGLTVKASDQLRLGFSFKTPTIYNNDHTYYTDIYSELDDLGNYESGYDISFINYEIKTPAKYNLGLAYVYNKGFFSIDGEYTDHSRARFTINKNSDLYNISESELELINIYEQILRDEIKTDLTEVFNLRVGTERVIDKFRLRAGFAYYPSLLTNNTQLSDKLSYSLGFGWHFKNLFIDLSGINDRYDIEINPYTIENQEVMPVKLELQQYRIAGTIGLRF